MLGLKCPAKDGTYHLLLWQHLLERLKPVSRHFITVYVLANYDSNCSDTWLDIRVSNGSIDVFFSGDKVREGLTKVGVFLEGTIVTR